MDEDIFAPMDANNLGEYPWGANSATIPEPADARNLMERYQEFLDRSMRSTARNPSFPDRDQRRGSEPAPDGERNTENLDLSAIEI